MSNSSFLSQSPRNAGFFLCRALVNLRTQVLEADGERHRLVPGMQVSAEIHLGTRTGPEYPLSPVGKAFRGAARER